MSDFEGDVEIPTRHQITLYSILCGQCFLLTGSELTGDTFMRCKQRVERRGKGRGRETRKGKGKGKRSFGRNGNTSQTPQPGIEPGTPANAADALPLSHRDKRHHQPVCLKFYPLCLHFTTWGVCNLFHFCQSFTSNFPPFSFPFLSLSLSLRPFVCTKKRTLRIYPINNF